MLKFEEVKRISVAEVLAMKYGVKVRVPAGKELGYSTCPLPTHRQGDKDKNFMVHMRENYFRCFSQSCNKALGKKGGDVINLVSAMERCSEYEAAKKLSEWFHINGNENAQHMAGRDRKEVGADEPHPNRSLDNSSSSDSGKGYIKAVDAWFDEVFGLDGETREMEYWKKARNAVKAKLIESYKNGKNAR